MFLLDSNVFIFAKRDYYPFDRVPEFWDWLLHHADRGNVKIPPHIFDELQGHDDELSLWLREHREQLIYEADDLDTRVGDVLACYCDDPTEAELEKLGADPFLVAAGLHVGCDIVSKEASKPAAQRANKKVPDICKTMGLRCINDHALIRELDFRTNWRSLLGA
jgi:Domain of unknown function (DUF4411)